MLQMQKMGHDATMSLCGDEFAIHSVPSGRDGINCASSSQAVAARHQSDQLSLQKIDPN
jgi:hypothetical protein